MKKIRNILTKLEFAESIKDFDLLGGRLHPLKGEFKGYLSFKVDKNFRIVFQFIDGNVFNVDFIDYH